MSLLEQGVDEAFDAAKAAIQGADRRLKEYLKEVRSTLGAGKEVTYVTVNKESHLIEVPEVLTLLIMLCEL